jgi:aerobic C4-dicarboxylate transport protein
VLIGTWVKEIERGQVDQVLSGKLPFDEQTMIAGHGHTEPAATETEAPRVPATV